MLADVDEFAGQAGWLQPMVAEIEKNNSLHSAAWPAIEDGSAILASRSFEPQSGAAFCAAECFEAYSHHLWTWFSVIGGQA